MCLFTKKITQAKAILKSNFQSIVLSDKHCEGGSVYERNVFCVGPLAMHSKLRPVLWNSKSFWGVNTQSICVRLFRGFSATFTSKAPLNSKYSRRTWTWSLESFAVMNCLPLDCLTRSPVRFHDWLQPFLKNYSIPCKLLSENRCSLFLALYNSFQKGIALCLLAFWPLLRSHWWFGNFLNICMLRKMASCLVVSEKVATIRRNRLRSHSKNRVSLLLRWIEM